MLVTNDADYIHVSQRNDKCCDLARQFLSVNSDASSTAVTMSHLIKSWTIDYFVALYASHNAHSRFYSCQSQCPVGIRIRHSRVSRCWSDRSSDFGSCFGCPFGCFFFLFVQHHLKFLIAFSLLLGCTSSSFGFFIQRRRYTAFNLVRCV